jgi:hypothetical protein
MSDRQVCAVGWCGRAGIVAVCAVGALVIAGRSLAGLTPHLLVNSVLAGAKQTLSVSASRAPGDDPLGRFQLFVPAGYALGSPAPGKQVGTVTAKVVITDQSPAAEKSLSGTVVAISPTDPVVSYEATTCDPGQHLAAWLARVGAGKTAFSFPIFVDAPSESGTSFGPYVLVACFRPPGLPPGDPGRSPNGGVIDAFTLALTPLTAPTTAGGYLWRSLWTPFAKTGGTLDPTGTVEAQSTVALPPGELTIAATKTTLALHGTPFAVLIVSGRVLVGGEPQAGVTVRIRHGPLPSKLVGLARVPTGSDGVYLATVVQHGSQYLQAGADLPSRDAGAAGCQPSFGSIPCLDATTGAGHLATGTLLIRR